ncbi:MAG TPA: OmpH family outer membrane protein, partial [Candidatus Angelobacter sp.]
MHSRSLHALFLLGFSLTSSWCFSQTAVQATTPAPASTGPSKIAFVNIQEAVVTCNEGKQEAAALQQRFATKTNALKAQDDELKKLKDDYQAQGPKLSEDERNTRLKIIQDKQKAFDRSYQDYQTETQEAQQEA